MPAIFKAGITTPNFARTSCYMTTLLGQLWLLNFRFGRNNPISTCPVTYYCCFDHHHNYFVFYIYWDSWNLILDYRI